MAVPTTDDITAQLVEVGYLAGHVADEGWEPAAWLHQLMLLVMAAAAADEDGDAARRRLLLLQIAAVALRAAMASAAAPARAA